MAEYIDKNSIYKKVAELEELARKRYLDTPKDSPCFQRYFAEMQERTALKHLIADTPAADVAPVVHARWEWFDENTGNPITGYEREWGWRCSHCKEELPDDYDDPDSSPTLRFCFNCGAKMYEDEHL